MHSVQQYRQLSDAISEINGSILELNPHHSQEELLGLVEWCSVDYGYDHCTTISYLGFVLWDSVDDMREYLLGDDGEPLVDGHGQELREDSLDFLLRGMASIMKLNNTILGEIIEEHKETTASSC